MILSFSTCSYTQANLIKNYDGTVYIEFCFFYFSLTSEKFQFQAQMATIVGPIFTTSHRKVIIKKEEERNGNF